MVKIKNISIRVPDDLYHWIDLNCEGDSISTKARNLLSSHILQKKYLQERRAQMKAELSEIEEALEENLFVKLHSMSKEEKEFLGNTKKVIATKPDVAGGQCSLFNKRFNVNLNVKEFLYLLGQA